MAHQGIPISESLLLMNGIVFTCILLASLVIALVAFLLLRDKDASRKKRKEAIRRLEAKSETDSHAAKRLKRLKRRERKVFKEALGHNLLIALLCSGLIAVNLFLGVIPTWSDYIQKDYVVYEGDFTVRHLRRNHRVIILSDGTTVHGALGLEEGFYTDTIVYSRRARVALGME